MKDSKSQPSQYPFARTTMPSPTLPSQETIPILSIGIHRLPTINSAFAPTDSANPPSPYRVVAFLDFDTTTTPPAYQYSAHNLAVLLHNLHPRPQALLTGTAVPFVRADILEEVRRVWDEYVRDSGENEGERRMVYIAVSSWGCQEIERKKEREGDMELLLMCWRALAFRFPLGDGTTAPGNDGVCDWQAG